MAPLATMGQCRTLRPVSGSRRLKYRLNDKEVFTRAG